MCRAPLLLTARQEYTAVWLRIIRAVPVVQDVGYQPSGKMKHIMKTIVYALNASPARAPTTSTDGTKVILTFSEDISAVSLSDIDLTVNSTSNYEQGATVSRSGRTVTLTVVFTCSARSRVVRPPGARNEQLSERPRRQAAGRCVPDRHSNPVNGRDKAGHRHGRPEQGDDPRKWTERQ